MRLGPLTSLGLGRSPYDIVVQGTGDRDIRAPHQAYDDRGRPINPTTRQINRDVIRSHNEVMLVIGVAEPDNGAADAAEAAAKRKHIEFENQLGSWLFHASNILDGAIVWGVNGMRQRVLLYKQFASASFVDLLRLVRTQQSASSYWLSGLPSFVLDAVLQAAPIEELAAHISIPRLERVDESLVLKFTTWSPPRAFQRFIQYATTYVRLHLGIFTVMQKVGFMSATPILPHWKFFVPGSSSSPIFIPPLPTSFTVRGIADWLSRCAIGILPFASCYLYHRLYRSLGGFMYKMALYNLPYPVNPEKKQKTTRANNERTTPNNVPASDSQDEAPRNGRDIARDQSDVRVLEGQPQNEALPVGGTRRQSTISVRGDDFASDEEEGDMISATLISFDVEATEATDSTPGVWSAELRPNMSDAKPDQGPKYRDTLLVRILPLLAAELMAAAATRLSMAEVEGFVWCWFGRAYLANRGLPIDALCVPTLVPFFRFDWRRYFNVFGLEAIFFTLRGGVWMIVAGVAYKYSFTDAQWNKRLGIVTATEDS